MEMKVSVSEAMALIKEVNERSVNVPAKILEYIGMNMQNEVGTFLTNLMNTELSGYIGRERYERREGPRDYRNGSYTRTFCIKASAMLRYGCPETAMEIFNRRSME